MKIIYKYKYYNSIVLVFFLYSLLMFFNCLLTKNAYSALHSGKVGPYSSSIYFTFNPAFLLLLVIFFVFYIKGFTIYRKNCAYLFEIIILFSGLLNGALFKYPKTYLFDILSIFFTSCLAIMDFNLYRKKNNDFIFFSKYLSLMTIFGFILLLIGKGKFGILPFEFSRLSRGEVTWWVILFIPVQLLAITLINIMKNEKNLFQIFLTFFTCIIVLSTSSRTSIFLFILLGLIFIYSRKLSAKKILIVLFFCILMLIFADKIYSFFMLGSKNSIKVILNGRYELWYVYWKEFFKNPFLGQGPNIFIEDSIIARSEIGILKDIVHYGIIFGIIFLYTALKAFFNSLKIIKKSYLFPKKVIFMAMIFFVSIITIIQQHARILSFSDFLCWYSLFYMANIKILKKKG